ncbi:hypothetical protein KHF85_06455 [Xanthomonas translucens pv. graminis]|uniref:hypothetical protein n=1 Tax=Xanthomonas graminis TaxID=3390026 RepID=UPI002540EE2C|nr:hypothetical protein [Xanthomonas translucens]WIH06080.1 hypothetical protein KHF85_06455 [Xanthomonas translucens pv. graminis]
MHMDIPRWNLMARNDHGQWTLSGPLDFGDAIVGHCDLFELPTPLIFRAQGNPLLATALLDAYGVRDGGDAAILGRRLMAAALIRPDCDRGVCMQQVPVSGSRGTGERIALQMFPV